jgi:hypothetical protein
VEAFFLILLIPVVLAFIGRRLFKTTITWEEMALQLVVVVALVTGLWFAGTYSQTADFEIWNGQVISKHRDHGHYLQSYQCNCRTTCNGESCSTTCDTCYEDRYTVDWYLKTTIGKIQLDYLDRGSRSVYNTLDPQQYVAAYVGEPCSKEVPYTNYIKAVPESLFNMSDVKILAQFDNMLPSYPRVHGYYKINRVGTVGVNLPNKSEWNDRLSDHLRTIGPKKQANIILFFVNTDDQSYRYALELNWLGGKKNDIIVIVGVTEYPNISWVDTITLGQNAGNSLMTVEMRDTLQALGTIENVELFVDTLVNIVDTRFDRKPMADFEYLKDSIQPPLWLIIVTAIASVFISVGLIWWFHTHTHLKIDWKFSNSRNYRRWR